MTERLLSPLSHLEFLYPPIEASRSGFLDVSGIHRIYWEEAGNPRGLPVVFLHGGPGGATGAHHRQFFDPAIFRYITMHQRGCGFSTPLAETAENTTQHLVADIEVLRTELAIDKWLVVGGSWGSTLALAYGEAHPERCLGFVLFGVTLGRERDRTWWWEGTRFVFPDAYQQMLDRLPPSLCEMPLTGLHQLLNDPDPLVHLPAARAVCLFSAATASLKPVPAIETAYGDDKVTLPLARLFVHYCVNDHFLEPDELLLGLSKINDLPCRIVAGRRDVTTPPEAAWLLHKSWPGSSIFIEPECAHSLADAPAARALLAAIEQVKELL